LVHTGQGFWRIVIVFGLSHSGIIRLTNISARQQGIALSGDF